MSHYGYIANVVVWNIEPLVYQNILCVYFYVQVVSKSPNFMREVTKTAKEETMLVE